MTAIVRFMTVFALKSGQGASVSSAQIRPYGLDQDRQWMAVRPRTCKEEFMTAVTQRDKGCQMMATLSGQPLPDGSVVFTGPDHSTVTIKKADVSIEYHQAQIQKTYTLVQDAGDAGAEWISDCTGQNLRLVKCFEDTQSLADDCPVTFVSEDSLDSIRPDMKPGMRAEIEDFRGNIGIKGWTPFQEDVVSIVKIGSALFEFIEPKSRKKMLNVDQSTGQNNKENFLKALAQSRLGEDGVYFGQGAHVLQGGQIRLGDEVKIISTKPMDPRLYPCPARFRS